MDPSNAKNPGCLHAAIFANSGKYGEDSIMNGQKRHGLEDCPLTRIRASAVLNMLSSSNDKSPEALCKVVNYANSGVWNKDMSFNQVEFDNLTRVHIISDEGAPAITYELFRAFLDAKHGTGYSGIMTTAYYYIPIPITYYQVTDGSVKELFNVFSDCLYNGRKAITIPTLKRFYTDPVGLLNEVGKKILTQEK